MLNKIMKMGIKHKTNKFVKRNQRNVWQELSNLQKEVNDLKLEIWRLKNI